MRAIFKLHIHLFLQAKVGFVHQRSALQSVSWAFVPEVAMGQAAKLAVNQRQGSLQGFVISSLTGRQEFAYRFRCRSRH
jgi:hypothetical protein